MKPRIGALVAALSLTLVAAACGGDDESSPAGGDSSTSPTFEAGTTMARIKDAGKITVGTKFDQPLFGLKGLDEKPQGFDVEVAKILATELGLSADAITWVETPSAVREEKIEQGGVDMVVATYTINDERKKRVTFAGPYYQAGQTLMVKADNSAITGPDSLKDKAIKVCSVTGSTPSENIKEYLASPDQLVLFDVYSKCADALRTGQVQVVTTDNVILLGLVDKSGGQFKLTEGTFTEEPYGIGVKKGDTAFCEFINTTLKKAADDGRYEKAWKDTAGTVSDEIPALPTSQACA